MKYYYLAIVILLAVILPGSISAQNKKDKVKKVTVSSKIVNEEGNGIPNATITIGEGLIQTSTDENGNYTIRAKEDSMLLVEALGYESKWLDLSEANIEGQVVLVKQLLFSSDNDVIELPLGLQTHQRSLTGAVSKISGEELESYPDLSLSNAFQGRLMGLTARQTVNGLGNNNAALYIRGLARGGGDGIITIVDGVERPIDYLAAEEIESVEILKDPTTKILYGPRAANGVMIITSKRGRPNTKVLDASVEYGASIATRQPQFLDSYEYARLYNEARANDGLDPFYSAQELAGYQATTGPMDQRYPEVDYYDYFLNRSGSYKKAALQYSGGDQKSQYMLVLAYKGGEGLEKVGTTPTLNRFNLRGNLDFIINDVISAHIGTSGYVENQEWGALNNSQVLSALSSHRPNEYPFIIDDESLQSSDGINTAKIPPLGGSFLRPNNLYGDLLYGGFSESQAFYGQANVGFDLDLSDFLLNGLTGQVYYTTDNFQYFQNGKNEGAITYAQRWNGESVEYYPLTRRIIEDNQRRQNQNFINNSGFYGTLAYDRDFSHNHFSAKLSHFYSNKDHDNWIQDLRFTNTVLGLKFDFNDKVYTEANVAYMGTNKLPSDTRYGVFPTFGAAWILSEENFLKENNFFNFLKLKASYGVLGYDRSTDYYLYENRWNTNGNVQFNERNNTSFTQTNLQSIGNPDLDWEKSREFNIGVEGLLSNNKLSFEANYFNEFRYDIIQSPGYRYSITSGDLYPQINQGETLNRGVEAMINWKDVIGDLNYSIGGNIIYSKNKILKTNEIIYPDSQSYIEQTDRPSDTYFGYVSEGLFTTQDQVDSHAYQTLGDYGIGSIAYRDLNSDGIIDNLDRKALGNSFPRTSLGVNLNLDYHRFNLFVLGTAELGVDNMRNNSFYWNRGEGKYSVIAANRYHPVNNPNGTYPALSTTSGANNFRNSDFWIQDASFFRLKNVELSYSIPTSESSVVKAYRIYARGTNLLVATENSFLDPEGLDAGVNNYPIFSTITAGLSVNF